MYATVRDSRDEEEHLQKTNIAQQDAREFTEKLEKFVDPGFLRGRN